MPAEASWYQKNHVVLYRIFLTPDEAVAFLISQDETLIDRAMQAQ